MKTSLKTNLERTSDRELVVTRTFNGPARLVFEAWTRPELLQRWWVPKSLGIKWVSCEADVRTGGSYRFVFVMGDSEPMAFFGKYLEVIPNSKIVWTNAETEGGAITTVTLEERGDTTLLTMHELFPSKEACDAELASGSKDGLDETFGQLDELIGAKAIARDANA